MDDHEAAGNEGEGGDGDEVLDLVHQVGVVGHSAAPEVGVSQTQDTTSLQHLGLQHVLAVIDFTVFPRMLSCLNKYTKRIEGLLPLSLKSILTARLVCKHWQQSIGCLVTQLHVPYETWTAQASSSTAATTGPTVTAATGGYNRSSDYVTQDSLSEADDDDDEGLRNQPDDDDIWVPPAAVLSHVSAAAAAATAAAVAAAKERAAATPRKRKLQQAEGEQHDAQQMDSQQPKHRRRRKPKQQELQEQQLSASSSGLAAEAPAGSVGSPAAAAAASTLRDSKSVPALTDSISKQQRPGTTADSHAAPGSAQPQQAVPAAGAADNMSDITQHVAVVAGRDAAAAAAAAAGETVGFDPSAGSLANPHQQHQQQLLAEQAAGLLSQDQQQQQQQQLTTPAQPAAPAQPGSSVPHLQQQQQHPLQQLPSSFPFCTDITLVCRNRSTSYNPPLQAALIHQTLDLLGQLPRLKTLTLRGSLPSGLWQQVVTGMQQQQQLQQRLSCLKLCGVDLPQPDVLESVAELSGLKELVLHASIKSQGLQPSHLEALACGTQLESLSLLVYQASGVNLKLNPLMELTGLKSLEVIYKGIFKDQRPTLSPLASISALTNLTSISSSGLASPLLPQPNMIALVNLSATGLTKRVPESALKTLSQCSSLRQIKLEAGRRGIAAVAADQLQHIGVMKHLTCVSLSLSKGALKAGASSQQLMHLSALTGLKGLTLSADHRLGFTTEQLQGLAAQWPKLETLRFNSFSPLQGLAGFGAFRGLVALSLKPGTGVGKLLFELREGLVPLENLKRLQLDFRGGLRLDHVEAIAEACSTRLQHLSLNMRASSIGSKAIVDIAQLQCLTSLQLLNTTAATLAGPPAAVALRSMKGLKWLSVQAAELAAQQSPSELGRYIADGVEGLECLQELRVWLGFGVEGRQAEVQLQRKVDAELPSCRVHVLPEPEKPLL